MPGPGHTSHRVLIFFLEPVSHSAVARFLGKAFAGGGEPPATDLDVLGGAVPADAVYVG
jgi:hypothetical protein